MICCGRHIVTMASLCIFLGCVSQPLLKYSDHDPPGIFAPVGARTSTDGRARFRELFCGITDARKGRYPDELPCNVALYNLDEPNLRPDAQAMALERPKAMKVVIITGIFGECISDYLLPFSDGRYFEGYRSQTDGYDYLHSLGFDDVEIIVTPGRTSAGANGRMIHERLAAVSEATAKTIVVIAYSKGVTDGLHALTQFQDVPRNIRAFVSVAGVVAGTAIADGLAGAYQALLKEVPAEACPPGDGGGVRSLSHEEQFRWLSRHRLPESVRYYSLAAFVPPERVNAELKPFHAALSRVDPRNDGQIAIQDAIVPGSTILGYLNADHFAVAIPFGRSNYPAWRLLVNHNAFPREVLFEAILRYVGHDIDP